MARSNPGDAVAIVGAGPVGLAALLTAQFYSPASIVMIDLDDKRLDVARAFGATALINSTDGGAVQRVMDLTAGQGVDVAIEAVGVPATFDICQAILAPGGRLANVGVHGVAGALHLEKLWDRNITITTRLVDTTTTPMLLKGVGSGRLQPRQAGHAPLRARRHHAGVRDVRTRRERGRAEGHSHKRAPWMTTSWQTLDHCRTKQASRWSLRRLAPSWTVRTGPWVDYWKDPQLFRPRRSQRSRAYRRPTVTMERNAAVNGWPPEEASQVRRGHSNGRQQNSLYISAAREDRRATISVGTAVGHAFMMRNVQLLTIDDCRWRRSNPTIPEGFRQQLVNGRWFGPPRCRRAGHAGDLNHARRRVHNAKLALGGNAGVPGGPSRARPLGIYALTPQSSGRFTAEIRAVQS